MRLSFLIAGSLLAASSMTAQPDVRLSWLGFLKGNPDSARLFVDYPKSDRFPHYAVKLAPKLFDPLNQKRWDLDSRQRVYFTKMILLLTADSVRPNDSLTIRFIIEKTLPFCTQCDGGCYKVRDVAIDTTFHRFVPAVGRINRHVVDVTRIVSDWHLIDLSVQATVFAGSKQLASADVLVGGWPWCQ
jgi:hypothetical protein